jgi:hypothetical protein
MTKRGRGVILHDTKEPMISGYLIIGNRQAPDAAALVPVIDQTLGQLCAAGQATTCDQQQPAING